MAENTGIEWCDSTFNPWIGCTKVSAEGCASCYAEVSTPVRIKRAAGVETWGPHGQRQRTSVHNWRQPLAWERQHEEFFDKHGRRRRVFCASLADVFDNQVPVEWRADLFKLIEATPHLDWLLLTKRIGNAKSMMFMARGGHLPLLPNLWLGATVVSQAEADRDVPKLLAVPARVRFLSVEPMLGPIDLQGPCTASCPNGGTCFSLRGHLNERCVVDSSEGGITVECICSRLNGLHWVICGGESGSQARPMHPDWPRGLRDQCAAAGVPFLFKQWGEWAPRGPECWGYPIVDNVPRFRMTDLGENGQDLAAEGGNHVWMNRAGKKAAGRLLDGTEHNAFPEPRT